VDILNLVYYHHKQKYEIKIGDKTFLIQSIQPKIELIIVLEFNQQKNPENRISAKIKVRRFSNKKKNLITKICFLTFIQLDLHRFPN
jgi:hypothetical protein